MLTLSLQAKDKTLPRIQNTSLNPKTLPRIQKHFPESKTLPKIQNTSQNPKHIPGSKSTSPESKTHPRILKHFPESKTHHTTPKHFRILGCVLDSGKCFKFWECFVPISYGMLWFIFHSTTRAPWRACLQAS